MAIKKEEFQALIEREGVANFIWTRTWRDVKDTEIGLFELANDRWGVIFRIYPPYYASQSTEMRLESFYKTNLPEDSSIQIFAFASKNIESFKESYRAIHMSPSNVGNEDVLKELAENRIEWMDKYKHESIFADKGQDVRIRNFVNLVCVTIPTKNENKIDYTESEIINIFSRVYTSLQDFSPSKFTQVDYVKVMRELLIPDQETLDIEEDKMTFLNTQVVDNKSILVIEEESDSLGIGTAISKEEYAALLSDENIQIETHEEEEDENKSFFQKLFEKKKEDRVERENYTKYHAKVLTTKMYPSHTSLFEMLSHFTDFYGNSIEAELPCQFFSSLTIYIEKKERLKAAVFTKTQWNLQQTSSLGDSARYFPKIVERAQESEAINLLLAKGDVPMSAMWSLILLDTSLKKVSQYSQRVQKNFIQKNWILQEESIIQHWIYLYSLPLQFEPFILGHTARMNTLFTSNCAAISPLMTGEHGFGSPVLMYLDRTGQLASFDIFASETNYNFLVIGSSGSGKSYLMADFFTNYLMTGAKIRVIDVGNSYKELNMILKGQYIEFTEEAGICLNFFTNVKVNKDNQIHDDELQNIVPLIGLMAMQSLSPEDSNNNLDIPVIGGYISEALSMSWLDRKRNAGMQDVLLSLEKIRTNIKEETGDTDPVLQKLIIALYPFGNVQGEYYKYFNGDNNLKFNNDFVVLELEDIDGNEHLKSVILASIATTINTEFFLGSREQRKILVVDEAWSIMDNKIVIRFLETMARRIRKHNGALGIITQSIGDFYKNKATKAIFDSTANKIFLKQNIESISAAEASGELNLDASTIQLMKTIKSKPPLFSELLAKQDTGDFFIGRLMTDRLAHWIYTNHPSDMVKIYEIMRKYSISQLDAKVIKGYSQKNKTSVEEELQIRMKKGLLLTDTEDEEELLKKEQEVAKKEQEINEEGNKREDEINEEDNE